MRRIPSDLAAIRRSRLLSQVDLAIETGIQSSVLSQIERGKREATTDQAERIAHVLRVPITSIFEDGDR